MAELMTNAAGGSIPLLAAIAWQSSAFLALGLAASLWLGRRPARAHRVLLLAMAAAVVAPIAAQVVRVEGWGLWTAAATARAGSDRARDASSDLMAAAPSPLTGPAAPPFLRPIPAAMPAVRALPFAASLEPARPATGIRISAAALVGWTWAGLGLLFLARLAAAAVAARRVIREAEPIADDAWQRAAEIAARRLGLPEIPELRASAGVRCPSIWCWGRRPVILLPADETRIGATVDWVGVFCHELAHRVRRDHWWGLFAEVLIVLVPWNPLAWLARHRLGELSELACDDWALASGAAADAYAESLLGLTPRRETSLALAAVSSRRGLIARIRHILHDRRIVPAVGRVWGVASAAIVAAAVSAVALAQARPAMAQVAPPSSKEQPASSAPRRVIHGVVLQPDGKPAAGARVFWIGEPNDRRALSTLPKSQRARPGAAPDLLAETRADDSGRFEIAAEFDPERYFHEDGRAAHLVVAYPGAGLFPDSIKDDATEVTLRLPAQVTIHGRLLTPRGTPAAGVRVALQSFHDDGFRHSLGSDSTVPDEQVPAYWPRPVRTGSDGRFTIEGVPEGTYAELEFRHDDYATDEITVNAVTRGGIKTMLSAWASAFDVAPVKPDFTHTLEPARPVVGRVTDRADGRPLGGLVVELIPMRRHGGLPFYTRTNANGRYRIAGHQADQYITTVYPSPESGYLPTKNWHRGGWPAGAKELVKDFALTKGRVVRGRVIDGSTNRPVAGASVIYQPGRNNRKNDDSLELRNPTLTDAEGRFALTVLPGAGVIGVETTDPSYMRRQIEGDTGPRSHAYPQGFTSIDVPKEGETSAVEIHVVKGATLRVRALDPEGKPVLGVIGMCEGIDAKLMDTWNKGRPFADGVFRLQGADPSRTYRVYLLHPGRKLGGFVDVKPDPKDGVAAEVRLRPTAKVHGKLVLASGSPAPGAQVYPAIAGEEKPGKMSRVEMMMSMQELPYFNLLGELAMMPYWMRMRSGRTGEFTVDMLIPGLRLYVSGGAPPRSEVIVPVGPLDPGEDRDLGTVRLEEMKQ